MAGIKQYFQQSRTRGLFIILGLVVLAVVVYVVFHLFGGGAAAGSAKVPGTPAGQQSSALPQAQHMSKEYLQALLQSNRTSEQQALKTGRSSIPSWVATGKVANVGGRGSCGNCCQACVNCCKGEQGSTSLLNKMVQEGNVSPAVAAELSRLQGKNISPADYAKKLQQLVKEGKLTPAQAKKLLAAYRKEHGITGAKVKPETAGDVADEMLASGSISPATAKQLQALNKQNLSPSDYAARLNKLVKAGKLTPEQAKRLLAAYRQQHAAKQQKKSKVATPQDLVAQLVKDGKLSPEIAKTLHQLDAKGVPASEYAAKLNELVKEGKLTPEQAKRLLAAYRAKHGDTKVTAQNARLAQLEREQQSANLQRQVEQLNQQRQLQSQREAAAQAQKAAIKLANVQGAMSSQAKALFTSWNAVPQTYQKTALPPPAKTPAEQAAAAAAAKGGVKHPLMKAGSIAFAVLDTGVNSDQPGPILATIVAGKLKGAKLIGGITLTPDGERVILQFNQLTMPSWPDVVSISAVAINPDTAHTAIASSVNHHYLMRYGSLFAASFLQGYSQALQQSGSSVVNNAGTTTQTSPNISASGRIMIGLGEVGNQLQGPIKQNLSRLPTVKVDAGVGMGILFTKTVPQPDFK